jgi:hypothetical protein
MLDTAKTLKEMEEFLPSKLFYRVHHSHLINIVFVKRFQKATVVCLLWKTNPMYLCLGNEKKNSLNF